MSMDNVLFRSGPELAELVVTGPPKPEAGSMGGLHDAQLHAVGVPRRSVL